MITYLYLYCSEHLVSYPFAVVMLRGYECPLCSFVMHTSNVDAVHVHHASLQLQDHDVTSVTAAQYMNVGVTSSDIMMEDNPAYQSIVMESAGSNYI